MTNAEIAQVKAIVLMLVDVVAAIKVYCIAPVGTVEEINARRQIGQLLEKALLTIGDV